MTRHWMLGLSLISIGVLATMISASISVGCVALVLGMGWVWYIAWCAPPPTPTTLLETDPRCAPPPRLPD